MRWIHLCAAACIASLLPSGASAKLIFDQSVDLTFGAAVSNDTIGPSSLGPQQIADDFKLPSGASTITDVHWWGLYGQSNTPETDFFMISIFADISGTPEIEPLNEFDFPPVNRVDTGVDQDGFDVFAYSVDIAPLTLAANTTYWLSIQNVLFDFDWLWNFEPSDVNNAVVRRDHSDAWLPDFGHFGFQLTDDALAVPEPATWALFAAGLAGLGLMNRRRKAK